MSVNREAIRQWVDALRSGKYKQGVGHLVQDTVDEHGNVISEYCCLGVLTDLCDKANVYLDDAEGELLPLSVSQWAGLDDVDDEFAYNDPGVEVDHGKLPLSQLNDNGNDFNTIADLIEREWLT